MGGTPGETGRGKEGSRGRGAAPPELEVKPSQHPCPKHRLRGAGRDRGEGENKDITLIGVIKNTVFCFGSRADDNTAQAVFTTCYEGIV